MFIDLKTTNNHCQTPLRTRNMEPQSQNYFDPHASHIHNPGYTSTRQSSFYMQCPERVKHACALHRAPLPLSCRSAKLFQRASSVAPAQVPLLVEVCRLQHRPHERLTFSIIYILWPPNAHGTPRQR